MYKKLSLYKNRYAFPMAAIIVIIIFILVSKIVFEYKSDTFSDLNINERNCFTFNNYVSGSDSYHLGGKASSTLSLPRNLLIQDEDSYKQLVQYQRPSCTDRLPVIDFSKETILGNYVSGNCGSFFEKNIQRNTTNKTVTFTIKKKQQTCRSGPPRWSMNLVSISKIPKDYTVKFIVK